jgi:hypothetical protein
MGNSWSSYEDFSEVTDDKIIKTEDKKKKTKKSKTLKKIFNDKPKEVLKIETVENKIHIPELTYENTNNEITHQPQSITVNDACSIPVKDLVHSKSVGKRKKTVKFRE